MFGSPDWVAEVASTCVHQLRAHTPRLLGILAVALLLSRAEAPLQKRPRLARLVFGAAVCAAIGWGLWLGWHKLWLCDDAFITFRYSWNVAHGQGLVFNVGEWVEGDTNFLWAVLLGALGKLGADIPYTGLFGDVAAFIAVLLLVAFAARRASPRERKLSPEVGREEQAASVIPWAALALAGSAGFTTWMTSGLETMPAAACATLAAALVVYEARPWKVGLALAAAALMRPDHLLFAPAMGIAFVVEDVLHGIGPLWRRLRWRRYFALAAPVALTFIPYWLIRWKVYGDFYPNTYYAKSGGEAYWSQGFVYLTHYLGTTGVWLAAPLLLLLLRPRSRTTTALCTFACMGALLLGAYVVRVGGDFMEQRFLIVLMPLIALALETSLRWQAAGASTRTRRWVPSLAGLAAVAIAVTPVRAIAPWEKRWHLADERSFYSVTKLSPLTIDSPFFHTARTLARLFPEEGELHPRLATGCVGFIAYYSRLPIVDLYGLTNRRIAHKPIASRGRPGHEKLATFDEVLQEQAELTDGTSWPGEDELTRIDYPGLDLKVVRYQPRVADRFRESGGSVHDPAAYIAGLLADRRRGEVLEKESFLRDYLRDDPDRDELLTPLVSRLGALADFEGSLPQGSQSSGQVSLRSGAAPLGASGKGWLSIGPGSGRWVLPIPPGISELRFALGGTGPGAQVMLEVPAAGGGFLSLQSAQPKSAAQLLPVAWPLESPTPAGARLVAEVSDPNGTLLLDSVHTPSADERALISKADLPDAEVFELLRELESDLPGSDARVARLRARLTERWTFDDESLPPDVRAVGAAFARPSAGSQPGQQRVFGQQGPRLLNSYLDGSDRATGSLSIDLPSARHLTVGALVGGGSNCASVFVGLEINGEVRERRCGKNDEVLRPVVLEAEVNPGDKVRLIAADSSAAAWGHLLLDDVQLVAR